MSYFQQISINNLYRISLFIIDFSLFFQQTNVLWVSYKKPFSYG